MVTGANELQQQIPEVLTGQIHSQSDIQRQESAHDTTMDTTLPLAEPVTAEQSQDPINRLTDVLVNLQNKPQSMTIRPVTTNPMTFDGKTEKFELFEDLFHTMTKMQPPMTEQMKINHFHSLVRKGALQAFRKINSISRHTLEDVLVIFAQNTSNLNLKPQLNISGIDLILIPTRRNCPTFLKNSTKMPRKPLERMLKAACYMSNYRPNSNDRSTWPG